MAGQYYWHRFYSHQPDLNWDNPQVRKTMFQVVDFWLGEIGVDGLRLDAVPYLFEHDGTNCENLPETHQALKELRAHIDARFKGKMLLAEANQWPEDSVAYFGSGDECHTAFHFPLMPRMFMAIQTEDRYPVVDMLEQTPPIPETCQWVLFLRNHDELTLEMVTDEERDYMYRAYAQDAQARINLGIRRRLAPLLGNSRRKIELMNALLLSLPGTPVVYYGDEIGMGDNFYLGDRNGVRTPMQWSPDRNAGFSRANSQRLYLPVIIDPEYHFEAVNVEVQHSNPQSLLWWMKRTLSLRKQYKAFGRGTLEFLYPDNNKILAFLRTYGEERILVVANLSRFSQHAELSLPALRGLHPVEMSGRSAFPPIGDGPYSVSLGPHGFFWFALEKAAPTTKPRHLPSAPEAWPEVTWTEDWQEHFTEDLGRRFVSVLPAALRSRSWFWGKSRDLIRAEIVDAIPVTDLSALAIVQADYVDGEPERYLLPVAAALGQGGEELAAHDPGAVLARLRDDKGAPAGVLYDAIRDRAFCESVLDVMGRRSGLTGSRGELEGWSDRHIRKTRALQADRVPGQVTVSAGEASVTFGSRFILRLVRRPEDEHPDLEVVAFLAEHGFTHCPPVRGVVAYKTPGATVHPRRPAGLRPARNGRVAGHPRRAGTLLGADPHRSGRPAVARGDDGGAGRARAARGRAAGHRALPGDGRAPRPSARRRCTSPWPPIPSIPGSPRSRFRRCTSVRSSSPCATSDAPSSIACAAGCARCPKPCRRTRNGRSRWRRRSSSARAWPSRRASARSASATTATITSAASSTRGATS